jgi:hypothetical protein
MPITSADLPYLFRCSHHTQYWLAGNIASIFRMIFSAIEIELAIVVSIADSNFHLAPIALHASLTAFFKNEVPPV